MSANTLIKVPSKSGSIEIDANLHQNLLKKLKSSGMSVRSVAKKNIKVHEQTLYKILQGKNSRTTKRIYKNILKYVDANNDRQERKMNNDLIKIPQKMAKDIEDAIKCSGLDKGKAITMFNGSPHTIRRILTNKAKYIEKKTAEKVENFISSMKDLSQKAIDSKNHAIEKDDFIERHDSSVMSENLSMMNEILSCNLKTTTKTVIVKLLAEKM